jgi:hypothetical protein
VTTLVQIEIVEDLSKEGGVAASQFENARFDFTEEVGYGLLSNLGVLFFRDLPGGFHHAHEVFVGGGAHGQISVVVTEFLHSDNTVAVSSSSFKV